MVATQTNKRRIQNVIKIYTRIYAELIPAINLHICNITQLVAMEGFGVAWCDALNPIYTVIYINGITQQEEAGSADVNIQHLFVCVWMYHFSYLKL